MGGPVRLTRMGVWDRLAATSGAGRGRALSAQSLRGETEVPILLPSSLDPRAASVVGRWGWHARFLHEAPPLAVILSGPLGLPLPLPIPGHTSEPDPLWRTGREPGPFCLKVGSRNVGSWSERPGWALLPSWVTPAPPIQASSSGLLWDTCARALCRLPRVLCHQNPLGPTHWWAGLRFLGPQVHVVDM